VDDRLTVSHADLGELRHPAIAWLTVRNSGRAAVASHQYDGGRPVKLKLGTPILQVLEPAESESQLSKPPPVHAEGDALLIGPGLLTRKQEVTYPVLVDGPLKPQLEHPLIDVDVRVVEPSTPVAWRDRPALVASITTAFVLLGGALAILLANFDALPTVLQPDPPEPIIVTTTVTVPPSASPSPSR
jgi:hypothetical protein